MTWGFTAQRRADEFDALVDGRSTSDGATRDADLLALVGAMRAVPEVHARPDFVADLRAQLMAEAQTALTPADTSRLRLPERAPRRERRIAALVGGIAIVGATTSVAVAAQSALPGETLYPIKRVLEGAHTGLSVGEGSKGATVLANAADRLAEVDALARQDEPTADLRIAGTLTTFTDQATEASDLLLADYAHTGEVSSVSALRDFAGASLEALAELEPLVPADARDELIRAAQVLQTIDTQAAMTCPSCGGPLGAIPPALAAAARAASEAIIVPLAPETGAGEREGRSGGKKRPGGKSGDGPDLPDVSSEDIGPGSVLNPTTGPDLPAPGATTSGNPLQQLADDLAGGLTGGNADPTGRPSVPVVDPLVGGVGDLLESLLDPVDGSLLGGQGSDGKKKSSD